MRSRSLVGLRARYVQLTTWSQHIRQSPPLPPVCGRACRAHGAPRLEDPPLIPRPAVPMRNPIVRASQQMRTYDRLAVEQEGSVSLRHLHGVVNPLMQLVQAVARHRRACHEQVGPPKVSALDVAHDALQRAPEEGVAGRGGHEADLHRRPVAQPQFHRGFRSSRRSARAYAAGCRSQPPLPLAPVGAEVAYLRSTHTSGTRRPLALLPPSSLDIPLDPTGLQSSYVATTHAAHRFAPAKLPPSHGHRMIAMTQPAGGLRSVRCGLKCDMVPYEHERVAWSQQRGERHKWSVLCV